MTDIDQTTSTSITRILDGVELPQPGTYVLDPTHTRIGFVARHLMVTKVRGHFATFEGSITISDEPHGSTADVTIQTASVDTGTPDRDAHLRSPDFFDVEKFPTLTFRNARVVAQDGTDFTVVGDLTIQDVTREVELAVELDGVVKDPWGGTRLAVTAHTEIDREDWGMTWNAALEAGGVVVSKKIRIEIESEAVLQS
jgi:polyisoprenoid-binding protein YceI